jgi:uncharacterized protein YecE (DUF72 family)
MKMVSGVQGAVGATREALRCDVFRYDRQSLEVAWMDSVGATPEQHARTAHPSAARSPRKPLPSQLDAGRATMRSMGLPMDKKALAVRVRVGIAGWSYPHWRGAFYPAALPQHQYLTFYAREFPTTEVNSSFYHFPQPRTLARWAGQVPPDFVFAVKANRVIPHTQRLQNVAEEWDRFTTQLQALGAHLGPILLQFPQSFQRDSHRLANFLQRARERSVSLQVACEFRHPSWFTEETYRVLRHTGVALCLADAPDYPREDILTADFMYFRCADAAQTPVQVAVSASVDSSHEG